MKRIAYLAFAAVLMGSLLFGCTGANTSGGSTAMQNLPEDQVVAWVNGSPIPKQMIVDMVATMPPQLQAQLMSKEGMKNLVENLVNVELVYQKAEKDGYMARPEVQAKIEQMKRQAVYSEYLKEKVEAASGVDDAAAKKYFEENKDKFGGGDKIRASHILFKTAEDGSDDAAKRKACEKLLPQAKKKGADFAGMAQKYSEGPTAPKGGDLDFFEPQSMVKPFADAALALDEGAVSDCVKSRFGYHIIKRTGTMKGKAKTFEEVKPQIMQLMARQGQQEIYDKLVNELKTGANIKYNDAVMDTMGK